MAPAAKTAGAMGVLREGDVSNEILASLSLPAGAHGARSQIVSPAPSTARRVSSRASTRSP